MGMVAEFKRQDVLLETFFDRPTPPTEEEARTAVGRFTKALLWADAFDPSMAALEMILNAGRLDLIFESALGALHGLGRDSSRTSLALRSQRAFDTHNK